MQRVQVDRFAVLHPSSISPIDRRFFAEHRQVPTIGSKTGVAGTTASAISAGPHLGSVPSRVAEFRVEGPFVSPAPEETVTLFAERVDPVAR